MDGVPACYRPSNENLVSDPVRPESAGRAAFLDLETVVRNVTDQLAGFRRRALAAEAQLRDLDRATARVAELEQAAQEARLRAQALERALAEAEQATARAVAEAAAAAVAAVSAPVPSATIPGSDMREDAALVAENAELRDRLQEAAERTRLISERVRFLRQQLGNGGDR
jgi:regulator of replication initiation timing